MDHSTAAPYSPVAKNKTKIVGGQVLVDSAGPELVIKIYFNFFQYFLKVLELFQCSRGDLYITAYRKFVRFA